MYTERRWEHVDKVAAGIQREEGNNKTEQQQKGIQSEEGNKWIR